MKYHDFTLQGYDVSDKGKSIILHLSLESKNSPSIKSDIRFCDVILYNFIHVSGSIITSIEEVNLSKCLTDKSTEILEWNRMFGVNQFKGSIEDYAIYLQDQNYKAWEITSAIGFYGFVIAQSVG